MAKAMIEVKRTTRIRMSAAIFLFLLIQVFLLYLLVVQIPALIGIDIIWLCDGMGNNFVIYWIGITAVFAGTIRAGAETSRYSKVEILHLRPLSPSFVFEPCPNCISSNIPSPQRTGTIAIREWYAMGPKVSEYLSCLTSLPRRLRIAQNSHHGMVVILRPSEMIGADQNDNKGLLLGVARGFFQAILLIFLTVLFGSTYRNSILESAIFVTSFIALIVISRTYSIYFCAQMEHITETVQIEFDTPAELTAIHTVLVGMPSVLIHNTTRQRMYAGGNCLTPEPGCTDHSSSIWKPLPPMIRITVSLFCGVTMSGIIMVVYYYTLLGTVNKLGYLLQMPCWLLATGIFVDFMVEKLFADSESVHSLDDVVGASV